MFKEWEEYRNYSLSEWVYKMTDFGVMDRGWGLTKWAKPIHYELMQLHMR